MTDLLDSDDEHEYDEPLPDLNHQTAFLIFQDEKGNWGATHDLDGEFSILRPASATDMLAGCAVVSDNINVQRTVEMTAQIVLNNMPQVFAAMGQQIQAQAQSAQIAQATGLSPGGLDLSALRKR